MGTETDTHIHHLSHCREKQIGKNRAREQETGDDKEFFSFFVSVCLSLSLPRLCNINVCLQAVAFSHLKSIVSFFNCPFITISSYSLYILCLSLAIVCNILTIFVLCCFCFIVCHFVRHFRGKYGVSSGS